MIEKRPRLNRFTSLPFLLDLLGQRSISLLSTKTWDDRNDAYFIEQYRERRRLALVAVVCFSTGPERFHHWKVFSNGTSGVCIEFDKSKLLRAFRGVEGILKGSVNYSSLKDLQKDAPEINQWPFLKRIQFKDEREFRIIYESAGKRVQSAVSFPIDLSCINKITLSPWLPSEVAESVKAVIRNIRGCSSLEINHSTLINNPRWRSSIGK